MVFDLRHVPSVIVNLSQDTDHRGRLESLLTKHGISHNIAAAETRYRTEKNVARAHASAFDTMDAPPFMVLEDDQTMLWDNCVLPDLPPDVDILYLATGNTGCLPYSAENRATFGINSYNGLALAEAYDEAYLRLHAMTATGAILVCSERGRDLYRLELKKAFNRSTAVGIRYAYAMPALMVYALRRPMFAASRPGPTAPTSSNIDLGNTTAELTVANEADLRVAKLRQGKILVQALRDQDTQSLKWQVLQAIKPGETFTPIEQEPLRLPAYNKDILKDRLEVIDNAKVFPPHPETGSCGVTDELGRFCKLSAEYKRIKRRSPAPETDRHQEIAKNLKGTYIYGGWLHPHFGHFLAESTVRLWALGEDFGDIDGVIFVPYGPKTIWRTHRAYSPILKLFTGDVPTLPQTKAAMVERLIVAEPGFGHQSRMAGSRKFIDFTRDRVAASISPTGGEKLYISRSELNHKRGGVFGEKRLEEFLTAQGYEIFHPQKHTAEEQLARYSAAKSIISLDGSPLHFAAFAIGPDTKVAIIKRRISNIPEMMANHIHRFSGASVEVIDAINEMWVQEQSMRIDYSSFGLLDMAAVTSALAAAHLCDPGSRMPTMTDKDVLQELGSRPEDAPRLVPLGRP